MSEFPDDEFAMYWAGGLWDGEGSLSTSVKKNGTMVLHASIQQNHPEVLEKFLRAVGVGKVYGPYGPYPGKARSVSPYWVWAIGGSRQVPEFFTIIRPYISSMKEEQGVREINRWAAARGLPGVK